MVWEHFLWYSVYIHGIIGRYTATYRMRYIQHIENVSLYVYVVHLSIEKL